jgi:hypothetical protein
MLKSRLAPKDIYPLVLPGNSAFHTPLLESVSCQARKRLRDLKLGRPELPLVDGRGKIWSPFSSDVKEIFDYTFGEQVFRLYNFTKAIAVCEKELSPDVYILMGPGTSLGGPLAQSLIQESLRGLVNKEDFQEKNSSTPIILSMGMKKDRSKVLI